jgi:hypothetical protein
MKDLNQINSIGNLISSQSAGIRSIPNCQRSIYLELYTLKNSQNRLEKLIYRLDKARNEATMQLKGICRRIQTLQNESQTSGRLKSQNLKTKSFKTMSINF